MLPPLHAAGIFLMLLKQLLLWFVVGEGSVVVLFAGGFVVVPEIYGQESLGTQPVVLATYAGPLLKNSIGNPHWVQSCLSLSQTPQKMSHNPGEGTSIVTVF